MNARGVTLVEALLALAVLGLAAVAILPALMSQAQANTRNEIRVLAVGAAQVQMEALRLQDPATLPTSGSSAVQTVTVGDREFEIVTHYCVRPALCSATSRHVTVEARYDSKKVYDVESIYTQLL